MTQTNVFCSRAYLIADALGGIGQAGQNDGDGVRLGLAVQLIAEHLTQLALDIELAARDAVPVNAKRARGKAVK